MDTKLADGNYLENVTLVDQFGVPISIGGNGSAAMQVQGNVAAGSADTGNPVGMGYQIQTTPITAGASGQRGAFQGDGFGGGYVVLKSAGGAQTISGQASSTDAIAGFATPAALRVFSFSGYFNGATWDRARGDTNGAYTAQVGTDAAAGAIVPLATTAQAASLILKAGAGNLYEISVTSQATAGYLMVFDATTLPANGTVQPKVAIPLAVNTAITKSYFVPMRFTTGIVAAFSSTGPFTLTASATAFLCGMVK